MSAHSGGKYNKSGLRNNKERPAGGGSVVQRRRVVVANRARDRREVGLIIRASRCCMSAEADTGDESRSLINRRRGSTKARPLVTQYQNTLSRWPVGASPEVQEANRDVTLGIVIQSNSKKKKRFPPSDSFHAVMPRRLPPIVLLCSRLALNRQGPDPWLFAPGPVEAPRLPFADRMRVLLRRRHRPGRQAQRS